jgi:hypothetical protein
VGIAIALLMTAKGMAFVKLSLNEESAYTPNNAAIIKDNASMGSNAPRKDFFMRLIFDLFNSNSSTPSSTIRISPRVPKTGRNVERFGSLISKKRIICLTSHPSRSSNITEGTLVLANVRSNKYAIRSKKQNVIIMVEVIFLRGMIL